MPALLWIGYEITSPHSRLQGDKRLRYPITEHKDKWLTFGNYNQKERLPFVVYADLECVLAKIDSEEEGKNIYQHKVFSIAYYVYCSYDNLLSAYNSRRSDDCVA